MSYSSSADTKKEGVGRKKCLFLSPGARPLGPRPPLLFPFPPLSEFPLRRLTLRVFLDWDWGQLPHVRGGEEF